MLLICAYLITHTRFERNEEKKHQATDPISILVKELDVSWSVYAIHWIA